MGRSFFALAAAALVAAVALRIPFVNGGLFHHDEVQLARAVEGSVEQGRLLPAVKGRYGAVILGLALYAPYHASGGRSAERVVPLVGILTGALLIAALMLLGRELTGDGLAGLFAGGFAGCGALFLTSSSTGKENVPQMAFAALGAWLLALGAARRSRSIRAAAAAVFAFALLIHEGGILLAPVFAILWVALAVRHGLRRRAIAIDLVFFAAAVAIPMKVSIWEEALRNLLVAGPNSATFMGILSPALPRALGELEPAFGLPVLLLALGGALSALAGSRARSLRPILPWLLVILYFGNVTSYTPRYLLYVLPPVAILAGGFASSLARRAPPRFRAALAAGLLVAGCTPGVLKAFPLLSARASHSGPKAMGLLVAERTRPGDIVLCQDDSPHLEYYAPGRVLLKQPVDDPQGTERLVLDLVQRARAGSRIYAGAHAFSYDDSRQFALLLGGRFLFVPVGEVLNESFHQPELRPMTFRDVLFRLDLR